MVWPASGTVTARFGEWRGSHRHAGHRHRHAAHAAAALGDSRARCERTGYVSGYDGYGQVVVLDLPGPYTALYAHLS